MKKYLIYIGLVLIILFLVIINFQYRIEINMQRQTVHKCVESWGSYVDSTNNEIQLYKDSLKSYKNILSTGHTH